MAWLERGCCETMMTVRGQYKEGQLLVRYNANEASVVPAGSRFESGVVLINLLRPHFKNEEMVRGMRKNKGTFGQPAW